jgi:hypothetical protein
MLPYRSAHTAADLFPRIADNEFLWIGGHKRGINPVNFPDGDLTGQSLPDPML